MSAAVSATGPKRTTERDIRIGYRIKRAREAMRMSQTALADDLGITFQQLQKYERAKSRISAARLQDVANLLGVPVASFYDDPGPVRVPPEPTSAEAWALMQKAAAVFQEAVRREAAALQVAA
ncbi:helix-turn-helix domain-containing protein [Methylobacterium organophilum]|nr:helix-turn-helix domain-containing protein [Methylobacterium organophilum]